MWRGSSERILKTPPPKDTTGLTAASRDSPYSARTYSWVRATDTSTRPVSAFNEPKPVPSSTRRRRDAIAQHDQLARGTRVPVYDRGLRHGSDRAGDDHRPGPLTQCDTHLDRSARVALRARWSHVPARDRERYRLPGDGHARRVAYLEQQRLRQRSARDAVLLRAAGKLRALCRHDERLEPHAERRDPPAAGEHADLALPPHGSREQRESRFPLLIGVPERRGADELRRHRPQLEQQAAQRVAVRIRGRDRDRDR